MPSWIIAALVGLGAGAWIYTKLARTNGNANPTQNMIGAAVAGFVLFLFVFSLLKLVFNF